MSEQPCQACEGVGLVHTAYTRMGCFAATCPRCDGRAVDPGVRIHQGMLLRNVRSGKVWAVYWSYNRTGLPEWGIHRMKVARDGGHYVWQILIRPEPELLDASRWLPVGFGDAWDHDKMESDPLRARYALV